MRKGLAGLLILTLMLTMGACGQKTSNINADYHVLMPYTLVGYFDGKTINGIAIERKAETLVYNASTHDFDEAKTSADVLLGNYAMLVDTDGDGACDTLNVIRFKDGKNYWDKNMTYITGITEGTEPYHTDEEARAVLEQENMIPLGERLLTGFGLGDWSGTTDYRNGENSIYWPVNHYYNATSSSRLTMLTGYKAQLQAESWSSGPTAVLTTLEWYGVRKDLNQEDLAALRGGSESRSGWDGDTSLAEIIDMYEQLAELHITGGWEIQSSIDDPYALFDPSWIRERLADGCPIIVGWNAFDAHYQVIIGYDTMGTETEQDDVLILMEPYDTTDHCADGYLIESYERLAYGAAFADPAANDAYETFGSTMYVTASPKGWDYAPARGAGIADKLTNIADLSNAMKLDYARTAEDLQQFYPDTKQRGENGLAGAATGGYERAGDYNHSPYYAFLDLYSGDIPDQNLILLTGFRTIQQSTEWTCGPASARMVIEWFNENVAGETDVSLAAHRQGGDAGATYLDGMIEIFQYMNDTYGQDWVWVSNRDLDVPEGGESCIGDYCLQSGVSEDAYGLIPYVLSQNVPILIGWDEWGGHWQVIIGYTDNGTQTENGQEEKPTEATQDDVLILADPYDTTDHNQDGYVIESFERLVYGWTVSYEADFNSNEFLIAFPRSQRPELAKALGL